MKKIIVLAILMSVLMVIGSVSVSAAVAGAMTEAYSMVARLRSQPGYPTGPDDFLGFSKTQAQQYRHFGPCNDFKSTNFDGTPGEGYGSDCIVDPGYPAGVDFVGTYVDTDEAVFFPYESLHIYMSATEGTYWCGAEEPRWLAIAVDRVPADNTDWDYAFYTSGSTDNAIVYENTVGPHWPPGPADTILIDVVGDIPKFLSNPSLACVASGASVVLMEGAHIRCAFATANTLHVWEPGRTDYVTVYKSPVIGYLDSPSNLLKGEGVIKVDETGTATVHLSGTTSDPVYFQEGKITTESVELIPLIPNDIKGNMDVIIKETFSGEHIVKFKFNDLPLTFLSNMIDPEMHTLLQGESISINNYGQFTFGIYKFNGLDPVSFPTGLDIGDPIVAGLAQADQVYIRNIYWDAAKNTFVGDGIISGTAPNGWKGIVPLKLDDVPAGVYFLNNEEFSPNTAVAKIPSGAMMSDVMKAENFVSATISTSGIEILNQKFGRASYIGPVILYNGGI